MATRSIGTLDFILMPAIIAGGGFSNSRVHTRWTYTVPRSRGDRMTGTRLVLPSETVVRNVSAKRVTGKSR